MDKSRSYIDQGTTQLNCIDWARFWSQILDLMAVNRSIDKSTNQVKEMFLEACEDPESFINNVFSSVFN